MIAEGNDELMEEFFATSTLPVEHIVERTPRGGAEPQNFPGAVSIGSAQHRHRSRAGVDQRDSAAAHRMGTRWKPRRTAKEIEKAVTPNGPASLFVFKTSADPFAGRVTFFKVITGQLKDDAHFDNTRSNVNERLAHIATPFGKALQPVTELRAGDIGVVAKLKDTLTGDTLCEKSGSAIYKGVEIPEPSIAYAISAKTRNDEDRLSTAIHKILEEDQVTALLPRSDDERVSAGRQRATTRRSGCQPSEAPLWRRGAVACAEDSRTAKPFAARRACKGVTRSRPAGTDSLAIAGSEMEPLPRGEKFQFANEIFGGSIPRQYVPAVEKGDC